MYIDAIADAMVRLQDAENTKLPALQKQLQDCEKAIQNMLNAIMAGILTPSTKQRLEELKLSILQEQLQKPKFTKKQIVTWISRFKYGDPDDLAYQKQIIDIFINAVYVYEDRLVLTYNYKDGTEPVTLTDSVRLCGAYGRGRSVFQTGYGGASHLGRGGRGHQCGVGEREGRAGKERFPGGGEGAFLTFGGKGH